MLDASILENKLHNAQYEISISFNFILEHDVIETPEDYVRKGSEGLKDASGLNGCGSWRGAVRSQDGWLGNDSIDQSILHGLFRTEEEISVGVGRDLIQWLAGEFGLGHRSVGLDLEKGGYQVAVKCELVVQNLVGLDFNVGSLSLRAAQRLMNHDPRI